MNTVLFVNATIGFCENLFLVFLFLLKYDSNTKTNIFIHKHKLTVIMKVGRINYPRDIILNVTSLSDKDTIGQK